MATDISVARSAGRRTAPAPRNLTLALLVIAVAQDMEIGRAHV